MRNLDKWNVPWLFLMNPLNCKPQPRYLLLPGILLFVIGVTARQVTNQYFSLEHWYRECSRANNVLRTPNNNVEEWSGFSLTPTLVSAHILIKNNFCMIIFPLQRIRQTKRLEKKKLTKKLSCGFWPFWHVQFWSQQYDTCLCQHFLYGAC